MFVYPNRRNNRERRSGKDRRDSENGLTDGSERRRIMEGDEPPKAPPKAAPFSDAQKVYYSTAEVAETTGLSQTTLLLWIRNKIIDGSRIKRSIEGRRLWTKEDIAEIRRIKVQNGWTE